MDTTIEAKSLSSLSSLAANPPLRRQRVHHGPVSLYIARVPGSRDVFLTPLKPRQKVVTAEDVESCLYYIHVNTAEDEELLKAEDEIQTIQESEEPEEPTPALPPRPSNAFPAALRPGNHQSSKHPLPPLASIPPYPLDDGPPRLNPTNILNSGAPAAVTRRPAPPTVRRKPVGEAIAGAQQTTNSNEERPFLAKRPTLETAELQRADSMPQYTIIRRDPGTGDQWNVGTVTDPPVYEVDSKDRRGSMTNTRIRKAGQPLYVGISNPGYAKFVTGDENIHPASPASSTPSLTMSNGTASSSNPEPLFTRRMWLEGSLFEKKASGHRKSLSADQAESRTPMGRPYLDERTNSDYSSFTQSARGSFDSAMPSESDMRRLSIQNDQKRSNTRGYTFLSPWDGRCEFASSNMGNALKCRHLPARNSLAPEGNSPVTISELRFNLPGGGPMASEPRRRSPGKEGKKESRRSRILAKFSDRHSGEDGMEESRRPSKHVDDDKMDLSLGQELAGGGFAGKQAKLGKLIIEGEGLLMMDLLVAANMGLWFRAYEKQAQQTS